MHDVIVIGGANSDFVALGPQLPAAGQTIEGHTFTQGPGGKGANQAVAVARLGSRVAFIGCLGRDERGEALLAHLHAQCVDVTYVMRTDEPTGAAVIMVDRHGQKQILAVPGANLRLSVAHIEACSNVIRSARVLLMPFEAPMKTLKHALRLAKDAGVSTVLDPAPPRELDGELLPLVDVIRPNAHEASALTGVPVTDRATARQAGQKLLAHGVKAALIGCPGGNLLVTRDSEVFTPHLPVKAVDATGAGDALVGALSVAIAEGQPLEQAVRFASTAAALSTTKIGAQAGLPTRAEVELQVEH
jgi:ribokinase